MQIGSDIELPIHLHPAHFCLRQGAKRVWRVLKRHLRDGETNIPSLVYLPGGLGAAAADEYDDGEKTDIPRPYKVAAVEFVLIRANGMWGKDDSSSDETPEYCKDFTLTEREVHAYFRHARRVSHTNFYHDLDMSRCYAAGEVVFANGDHGEWKIDAFSRGVLHLASKIDVYFIAQNAKGFDVVGHPSPLRGVGYGPQVRRDFRPKIGIKKPGAAAGLSSKLDFV